MKRIALIVLALSAAAIPLGARVSLPFFFCDHMVLQQQTEAPLWGKASPGATVTVTGSWDGRSVSARAGSDGNWRLAIPTPEAGGPYVIRITENAARKAAVEALVLKDVLIGEVWLCGGQSNMEMPVKGFTGQPVDGSAEVIADSADDGLRLFTVKRDFSSEPKDDVSGSWTAASPATVREFSATGYFFGALLRKTLGVPVGLIMDCWGGSCIEAWMSKEALADFPGYEKAPHIRPGVPNRTPAVLYNAMIHPLVGYGMRGAIWYQGETNKEEPEQYVPLFRKMISQWRGEWGYDFPFYFCQIAPYAYSIIGEEVVNSAYLREAQLKVSLAEENVGMAVLMDAGLYRTIHPSQKRQAGERLAYQALAKTYGMAGIVADSPVPVSFEVQGEAMAVNFEGCDMWLYSPNIDPSNFTLAGEDRVFHPANAKINRKQVIVTSPEVPNPVAVRYAFENWVVGDLFGTEGLPVSSFRSDDWPVERNR